MEGVAACIVNYYGDNRKKEKETLEQLINRWIAQKKYSESELNNIINNYGKRIKNHTSNRV